VEDDLRGETYIGKIELRLLEGKRKGKEINKIQSKKETNLRDGESDCDFILELEN